MNSSDSTSLRSRFTKRAYACHLCLAVIAVPLVVGMADLQDAPGDVVGAAIFFFVIWLGLPSLLLALYALYCTVKAQEPALWALLVTLSGFFVTGIFPTPTDVYVVGGGLYIALVIGLWLVWLRRRRRAADDNKAANGAE